MAYPSRQAYIEQVADYAIDQMIKYGIPASVTLAQACIESGNGGSVLATEENAHFGIKATKSWIDNGGGYRVMRDDKPDDKFRTYSSVAASFEDHSKFLLENKRYAAAQSLAVTDHAGWAHVIASNGYATGKNYESTIEAIIKANNLDQYDQMAVARAAAQGKTIGYDKSKFDIPSVKTRTANPAVLASTTIGTAADGKHYAMPIAVDGDVIITSKYGNRVDPMDHSKTQNHRGVDIRCNHVPLYATEDNGKVVKVSHDAQSVGGKGVHVEYTQPDGSTYRVFYCHMSQVDVKVGDVVQAGQQLGISGNTGQRSTGPHLHMAVERKEGDSGYRYVDPGVYLANIVVQGNLHQDVVLSTKLDKQQSSYIARYMSPEEIQRQHNPAVLPPDQAPLLAQTATPQQTNTVQSLTPPPMGFGQQQAGLFNLFGQGGGQSGDFIMDLIESAFMMIMNLLVPQQQQITQQPAPGATKDMTAFVPSLADKTEIRLNATNTYDVLLTKGGSTTIQTLSAQESAQIASIVTDKNLTEEQKAQGIANSIVSVVAMREMNNEFNLAQAGENPEQQLKI